MERDAVTAQEGFDLLDVGIAVRSDNLDRAGALPDKLLPPRRKYRDDLIGKLRNLGHEVEHGFTGDLDSGGAAHRAHREKVVAAAEEGQFADELAGAEGVLAHPLFEVGVEHLHLAFDDIYEAIHRVAEASDHLASVVRPLASDRTDGVDVPGRERNRLHQLKIGADSFHPSSALRGLGRDQSENSEQQVRIRPELGDVPAA